ncbi:MAG: hypothetical protein M3Y77_19970 [Actinomycetota bacterium]|nr:hypothetical protein [Actinomycetota bacterium]
MTDRDDSLQPDPPNDQPLSELPQRGSGGSTPMPRPDSTGDTNVTAGHTDSDASTVFRRADRSGFAPDDDRGDVPNAADTAAYSDYQGRLPTRQAETAQDETGSAETRAFPQQYSAPQAYASNQQAYGSSSEPYASPLEMSDATAQRGYAESGAPVTSGNPNQSGLFSPQGAQQPVRVDVAPPKTRVGHNLLGALIGLVFVAGAAAIFALAFKNYNGMQQMGTGHKLAFIGIAVILAVPALLAGWAPAAAWFPGIVLVLGIGIAMFSGSLSRTYAHWSTSLFGTPAAATYLLSWGLVAGSVLLLAGIGAQMARRSASTAAMDRIVNH